MQLFKTVIYMYVHLLQYVFDVNNKSIGINSADVLPDIKLIIYNLLTPRKS